MAASAVASAVASAAACDNRLLWTLHEGAGKSRQVCSLAVDLYARRLQPAPPSEVCAELCTEYANSTASTASTASKHGYVKSVVPRGPLPPTSRPLPSTCDWLLECALGPVNEAEALALALQPLEERREQHVLQRLGQGA